MRTLLACLVGALLWSTAANAQSSPCFDLSKGEIPRCDSPDGTCQLHLTSRKFALIFGNNDYDFDPLTTSVQDAVELANELSKEHSFNIRCVLNATRDQAIAQVNFAAEVAKELGSKSTDAKELRFLVYFSGHGFGQSQSTNGYLVFSDAKEDAEETTKGTIQVDLILQKLARASKVVHPFLLIDACRLPRTSTNRRGPASTFARADASLGERHRRGFFIGYSVAASSVAPDDKDKRFLPRLVEQLKERGRTFFEICDWARIEHNARNNSFQTKGPTCTSHTTVADEQFFRMPADPICEGSFKSIWRDVAQKAPTNASRLAFLDGSYRPDGTSCFFWKSSLQSLGGASSGMPADCAHHDLTCAAALRCRFGRRMQPCDTGAIPQIASIAFGADGKKRTATRLRQIVSADDPTAPIGARPTTSRANRPTLDLSEPQTTRMFRAPARSLTTLAWKDVVIANRDTGLRTFPLAEERPHTPIEKGAHLKVDCRTLRCDEKWVGVRYSPPGTREVWRTFVPISDVDAEVPQEKVDLSFKDGGEDLDAASLARVEALVKKHGRQRESVRLRLAARFGRSESDAKVKEGSRLAAVQRLSAIDGKLRKTPFFTDSKSWETKRKYELLHTKDHTIPEALIEVYYGSQ